VRARDNIPILSYFLLRGRCRRCGVKFSGRHALVEALTGALSALVLWAFALDAPGVPLGVRVARFAVYFAFTAVLVVLTFIDLDTKRLPDIITLPSIVVFFLGGFATGELGWSDRAIGAAAGYLFVRLIADAYYYSTGREGLGLGDGKLLAMMGALLGWKALPPIVCAASLVGIVVSVPALLIQRRRAVAVGPTGVRAEPAGAPAAPPQQAGDAATAGVPNQEAKARPAPGGQESHAGVYPPMPVAQADASGPPETDSAASRSIRRAEVPFGPFLSASALAYLFLHRQIWLLIERVLLGGPWF